jgi:hypothetical protein
MYRLFGKKEEWLLPIAAIVREQITAQGNECVDRREARLAAEPAAGAAAGAAAEGGKAGVRIRGCFAVAFIRKGCAPAKVSSSHHPLVAPPSSPAPPDLSFRFLASCPSPWSFLFVCVRSPRKRTRTQNS